ncbi:MAG: hypothetical protein FH751_09660 [Firmicutes bacterium]|nr:hypothetical protein [Bacillota bacterium]
MSDFLDKSTEIILRAFFDVLRIFLIATVLIRSFYYEFELNYMFQFSLIVVGVSYIVSYLYVRIGEEEINRKVLPITGIIVSISASKLSAGFIYDSLAINFILFFYYTIIWIKGMNFIIRNDTYEIYFKRFIFSICAIFFVMMTIGLGNLRWFMNNLETYFIGYFLISILYLTRLNLLNVYSNTRVNMINKKRNLMKFNIFSSTGVLVLFFLIFNNTLKIKYFNIAFEIFWNILVKILYPFVYIFYKIAIFLRKRTAKFNLEENDLLKINDGNGNKGVFESLKQIAPERFITIINAIFKWGFILIITGIVIYIMWKLTKEILVRLKETSDNANEEKDYIYNKEDIKKNLTKSIKKVYNTISNIFSKEESKEKLSKVRIVYIQVVNNLINKGYKYKTFFTPNEYLMKFNKDKITYNNLSTLTKYYNKDRYGNKDAFTKEEIERLNEIEKNMDKDKN